MRALFGEVNLQRYPEQLGKSGYKDGFNVAGNVHFQDIYEINEAKMRRKQCAAFFRRKSPSVCRVHKRNDISDKIKSLRYQKKKELTLPVQFFQKKMYIIIILVIRLFIT